MSAGFSQGSSLASLLMAKLQQQQDDRLQHLQFAILVCPRLLGVCSFTLAMCNGLLLQAGAFLPKDAKYAGLLSLNALEVPTLFVYGEQDQLVPPERTQQLISMWDPACAEQYQHQGGHMVPTCTGNFKRCLQDFLNRHGKLTGSPS